MPFTYGHRQQKIGHPVRSAIHKLLIGRLVVGSVTTSESLLLYVFALLGGDGRGWEVRDGGRERKGQGVWAYYMYLGLWNVMV
jgi:hypothetical protein